MNRALNRLPLPLFFAVFFGLLLLVRVGLRELFDGGRLDATQVVIGVVVALGVALVGTLAVARRRRRLGGAEGVEHYTDAVRTGTIPEGADTSGWVAQLEARQRSLRYTLWRGVVLSVLLVAVGAFLVVTGGRAGAAAWILVALGVVTGPLIALLTRVSSRRVRVLLDQLDTGSPVAPAPPRG